MKRLVLVPWSCALLAACGGAPPPTVVPAPVATASVAAPEAEPAPDLSPVAEPKDLLVVGRWARPGRGIDEVLKYYGVPLSVERLLEQSDSDAALFDLNAFIDVAVALDPESTDDDPTVLVAASIPVKDFEAAKASGEKDGKMTPIAPGVFRQEGKHKDKTVCDLAMAAGDAPARIVCGDHARDLDALRPWLVRGLSRTPPATSDIAIDMRAAPLRARYVNPLRTKGTAFADEAREALTKQNIHDPDLLAAPGILVDEGLRFLEDLDGLDLRVSFGTKPPQLIGSGTLRFGGRAAWLTRALTNANDKAGPPPALFWRAPRDATSATWGRGHDPQLYEGIRRVLHKALAEVLAQAPVPEADKGALLAFIDGMPAGSGAWVTAQGLAAGKAKAGAKAALAKATLATSAGAPVDVNALAKTAIGWTVAGVEAPAADYVAWAKQGADVYARVVRLLHDYAKTAKASKKDLDLVPKLRVSSSPPGWPKGTVAFDLSVSSELPLLLLAKKHDAEGAKGAKKPARPQPPVTLRLAIVPEGDHTWIGFSADLDDLKKRMVAVMASAPKDGTLAARDGLDPLRAPGQTWGGFFSVGELLERAVEEVAKDKPEHAAEARAALAALPNRGRTPVLLVGSGTGGDKPSGTAEIRFQAGTLADVAAVVSFLVSPKGKELLKKL